MVGSGLLLVSWSLTGRNALPFLGFCTDVCSPCLTRLARLYEALLFTGGPVSSTHAPKGFHPGPYLLCVGSFTALLSAAGSNGFLSSPHAFPH